MTFPPPPQQQELARRPPTGVRLAGPAVGAATFTTGLIAGFFFDWAVAVMPALAGADDRTFTSVMLDLITTIDNSAPFVLAFTGALVFTVAAGILLHRAGARSAARWAFAALGLYVVACAITFGVHFPLHEALADGAARENFEDRWVTAHLFRTATTMAAFGCLCRALYLRR